MMEEPKRILISLLLLRITKLLLVDLYNEIPENVNWEELEDSIREAIFRH